MSGAVLSAIVAHDRQRAIGVNGALPWRLPDDLAHFKALTLGNTVLMGRKTWDSLGRPLPGRDNWVLTRDPAWHADGCRVFHTLDDALSAACRGERIVIGGEQLYRLALPWLTRIHLTEVDVQIAGADAWFPELTPGQWRETSRTQHAADARHAHAFSFVTLERVGEGSGGRADG